MIRRALVSTYDKDGVAGFCRRLHERKIEIVSSGGTARLLESEGIPVVRVSDLTGFPEMLDGRVKTLHPHIHAGILAIRSRPEHMADLEKSGIRPIDLVVVNLYPFEKTVSTPGVSRDEVVEMIDIGGPGLIRAAAKNHAHVGVVVASSDYDRVAGEIEESGSLSPATRERLALKAFRHTARYDDAIQAYFSHSGSDEVDAPREDGFPETYRPVFVKAQGLRYGENPHQQAAFYREGTLSAPSVAKARQFQGKELSFNNILDFDGALNLAADFSEGACVIIKHGNPCGAALGSETSLAFRRALECDPESAFGGVIAFNRPVDAPCAEAIAEAFYEGVVAPDFGPRARQVLARKKKMRLLVTGDLSGYRRVGHDLRRVGGGLLVQDWDHGEESVHQGKVATRREPTESEWKALEFAWTVVRHVKSNAIVYALEDRTVGIGAGQMSRVDSARLGVQKARVPLRGAVMASDAFFPFRDGLDVAARAGVGAVVQPGGSIRDDEVIAAANEHRMAMVFTGRRHFRH